MKGDSCLEDVNRDRNGDQWTYLGNIEEVRLTRLGSKFKMRGEEEGEGYMRGNC